MILKVWSGRRPWGRGVRALRGTYVVMEGLGLAGVLARLPPVWSRTIQIPEHAVEGGEGRWGGREVRGLANGTIAANVQQLLPTNLRTLAIAAALLQRLSHT